jgi:hypothetical protein
MAELPKVAALAGASAPWFERPVTDDLVSPFARADARRPGLQIVFRSRHLLSDDRLTVVNRHTAYRDF